MIKVYSSAKTVKQPRKGKTCPRKRYKSCMFPFGFRVIFARYYQN